MLSLKEINDWYFTAFLSQQEFEKGIKKLESKDFENLLFHLAKTSYNKKYSYSAAIKSFCKIYGFKFEDEINGIDSNKVKKGIVHSNLFDNDDLEETLSLMVQINNDGHLTKSLYSFKPNLINYIFDNIDIEAKDFLITADNKYLTTRFNNFFVYNIYLPSEEFKRETTIELRKIKIDKLLNPYTNIVS